MISGEIVRLAKQNVVRGPSEYVTEMNLIENVGIEGNAFQGGDKQVCIFSTEARVWMAEQTVRGLCFKQFTENILIGAMQPDILKIGDVLFINGAHLMISGKKRCFDECELYSNNIPCLLSANAFFATVKKGGVIKVRDKVVLI